MTLRNFLTRIYDTAKLEFLIVNRLMVGDRLFWIGALQQKNHVQNGHRFISEMKKEPRKATNCSIRFLPIQKFETCTTVNVQS